MVSVPGLCWFFLFLTAFDSGNEANCRRWWVRGVRSRQRCVYIEKIVVRALIAHHAPGNLALSRAIGDFEFKKNHSLQPEKQIVTADPDVLQHVLTDDEEFLILACDGA